MMAGGKDSWKTVPWPTRLRVGFVVMKLIARGEFFLFGAWILKIRPETFAEVWPDPVTCGVMEWLFTTASRVEARRKRVERYLLTILARAGLCAAPTETKTTNGSHGGPERKTTDERKTD